MTIRSMPATPAFREGWDRIFGRKATADAIDPPHGCDCAECHPQDPFNQRMIVCGKCGNKRCPAAESHRYECTGSNEPGQIMRRLAGTL